MTVTAGDATAGRFEFAVPHPPRGRRASTWWRRARHDGSIRLLTVETGPEHARVRRVRAVRGTAASAIAVLFAATAHTLAGGHAPPVWLVLGVAVLAAPLCVMLVGRRRSLIGLAAAVGSAQAVLHVLFSLVGDGSGAAAPLAHHVHGLPAIPLASASGGASAATGAVSLFDAVMMILGHASAALVTFAVLAWGEHLAAAIARGIRRLFGRMPTPHLRAPVATTTVMVPRCAHVAAFLLCVTRRGPPGCPASVPAV